MKDVQNAQKIPKVFLRKRVHSISGIFLILFLIEHLFTNSQAALWDDGLGFVRAVNWLHSLPYLPIIEFSLLFIPFSIHGICGLISIYESKLNSFQADGSTPSLPQYKTNQAFTWQRITALLLIVAILYHVIDMRFIRYPEKYGEGLQTTYSVEVSSDKGLPVLTQQLQASLITPKTKIDLLTEKTKPDEIAILNELTPTENRWYVLSDSFGTVTLFTVRDAFRSLTVCIVYTFFVGITVFHAINGFWTALITWGISVSEKSRRFIRLLSYLLGGFLLFLGYASIWCTHFETLFKT